MDVRLIELTVKSSGSKISLESLPSKLWSQVILFYLGNIQDLGHLAKVAKTTRSFVFQYLNSNIEQLNTLLNYINVADRLMTIESKKNDIARHVTLINTTVNTRLVALREIEEKRLIKKSTLGRLVSFIPGPTLIFTAIPKFLAAISAREMGEVALRTRLLPTCQRIEDFMVSQILNLCGESWSAYILRYCGNGGMDTCHYWSSSSTGTSPFACHFEVCHEIVNDLLKNAANKDWEGGWYVTAGILALIIAGLLFIPLGKLSHVPIDVILSKPFSHIFNDDFQKLMGDILQLDQSHISRLPISQVLHQLQEVETLAIQNKNKLLCSAPLRKLQSTLFFKFENEKKKKNKVHIIDIKENLPAEDKDSLTTPLLSRVSMGRKINVVI